MTAHNAADSGEKRTAETSPTLDLGGGVLSMDSVFIYIHKTDEPGGAWLFSADDNNGFEDWAAFRGLAAAKAYGRSVHGAKRYYRVSNGWRADVADG